MRKFKDIILFTHQRYLKNKDATSIINFLKKKDKKLTIITHTPSGIVVTQQDEKSQHKNKAKALKILRARLYESEKLKKDKERSSERKNQIGSGDRSERIRTYNFPQGRVTDHRINFTLHKLTDFLNGEIHEEMNDNLRLKDQDLKLKALN